MNLDELIKDFQNIGKMGISVDQARILQQVMTYLLLLKEEQNND